MDSAEKAREINDPIEKIVADALDKANVSYRHDDPLDFECDGFAIEVKQFSTERTAKQIGDRTDVILIQGRSAADAFANLLHPERAQAEKEAYRRALRDAAEVARSMEQDTSADDGSGWASGCAYAAETIATAIEALGEKE